MEQPDYIEVRLHYNSQNPRDLRVPSSLRVAELKEQISLSKAMSKGAFIEANRILLRYKNEILPDEIALSELGARIIIDISIDPPSGLSMNRKDVLDLTLLSDRLRELSRADLPATKQRHFIHEHHRKVSAAVINAMTRSKADPKYLPIVPEPILEEESDEVQLSVPGIYGELPIICEQLIDILESQNPHSFDIISEKTSELADCILSVASFVHIESDFGSYEMSPDLEIGTILCQHPVDRQRFSSALISYMHGRLNGGCSFTSTPSTMSLELARHISDGSSRTCIGKSIQDLVSACCNTISSPTRASGNRALLPNPSEKTPLSPEIANWAKGLKPKRKLSRP